MLLLVLGSHLSFMGDDWGFLLDRRGWTVHSLLDPNNEHIALIPVVIYKLLQETFGMSSAFPFRVASTSVFLVSCVLLFAYLRRRGGALLALIAATLILFLGAAWEDLLWAFQIGFFGSMAGGLGMLLALERRSRTGDRVACVLLSGSMAFSSLGLSFAAGAVVDQILRRDRWRQRVYVVAIPIGLYAIWWLGWGHTGDKALTLHNIGTVPITVVDAIAAGIAALLGLANTTSESPLGSPLDWGRPLLVPVLGLVAWRLYRMRRVPPGLWIPLAIGFSFWILAALNVTPGRNPTVSRYQYMNAIFILLIAAELLRGIRIGRGATFAVAAVAAAAILGNLTLLSHWYHIWKDQTDLQNADLAALELIRGKASPTFTLTPHVSSTYFTVPIGAGRYFAATDDFGSPADTPAEFAASPDAARAAADKVLAAGLDIKLTPASTQPSPRAGPRPELLGPTSALAPSAGNCLSLAASATAPPLLRLPPGGAALGAGTGSGFEVRVRRFASNTIPVDLGKLQGGESAKIAIPTDRSKRRWNLSLDGSGPVTVCGLRTAG